WVLIDFEQFHLLYIIDLLDLQEQFQLVE
ncbi:uncharacterized protein METZ01_LOCUS160434, partial [marine metagenome]